MRRTPEQKQTAADKRALNDALDAMAAAKTTFAKAAAKVNAEGIILKPITTGGQAGKKVPCTPNLASIAAELRNARASGAYDGGCLGDDFTSALITAASKQGVDAEKIPTVVKAQLQKLI